jgi:TPR repeat protein
MKNIILLFLALLLPLFADSYRTQVESKKATFESDCKKGKPKACTDLGRLYDTRYSYATSVLKKDMNKAKELYIKSCNMDEGMACYYLATMYDFSEGVQENKSKALKYYKKGCKLNENDSCLRLGKKYHSGEGVKLNFKNAAHYYAEACNRKKPVACYYLGQMYIDGRGVKKDKARGEKILCIACSKGIMSACSDLGIGGFWSHKPISECK